MWPSLKPSQRVAIIGAVDPQSATTVKSTAWIDASQFVNFLAVVEVGAISASGTVDAKFQQAQDSSGTGAKDITGKAIAQLTQAGGSGNQQCLINLKQADLDVGNGFKYVKLLITPAAAAALIGGQVIGFDARYEPADGYAAASQVQIVV